MKCICRYNARKYEEMFRMVAEHIKRGGKGFYAVYEPLDAYIEHLRKHGIRHKVMKIRRKYDEDIYDEFRMAFVLVDENYVACGAAGIGIIVCLLDGEDLETAISKYLNDDVECITLT